MGRFKKVPSKTRGLKASTHTDDTWMYYNDKRVIIKRLEEDLQAATKRIVELERDFNKLAQYIIDEQYKIK